MPWCAEAVPPPFFPVDDLVRELFGATPEYRDVGLLSSGEVVTDQRLADACGVSQRTVLRWHRHGLRIDVAEKVCDHLGLHPMWVWPDYHAISAEYIEYMALSNYERSKLRARQRRQNTEDLVSAA